MGLSKNWAHRFHGFKNMVPHRKSFGGKPPQSLLTDWTHICCSWPLDAEKETTTSSQPVAGLPPLAALDDPCDLNPASGVVALKGVDASTSQFSLRVERIARDQNLGPVLATWSWHKIHNSHNSPALHYDRPCRVAPSWWPSWHVATGRDGKGLQSASYWLCLKTGYIPDMPILMVEMMINLWRGQCLRDDWFNARCAQIEKRNKSRSATSMLHAAACFITQDIHVHSATKDRLFPCC